MGEKQIRAHADRLGTEALRPMFETLANLVVAADAAAQEDQVRAAAKARAQRRRLPARSCHEPCHAIPSKIAGSGR